MQRSRRRFLQTLAGSASLLASGLRLRAMPRQSPCHRPDPTDCLGTPSVSMSASCSASHGPDEYVDQDGYWRHRDEEETEEP